MGTCRACARERDPRVTKKSRSTRSTRMREMSFTPPLPSVLATTATMSSAPNFHSFIAASMPAVSWTCSMGTLHTTNGMAVPLYSQAKKFARIVFSNLLYLVGAKPRRPDAGKRIAVGGREGIVAPQHDPVGLDAFGKIAQRRRIVEDRVVPHAPQVARGL